MGSEITVSGGPLATPSEIVSNASEVATLLTTILREQNLVVNIQGSEHVLVEGWTLLAGMMGHSVGTTNTRPVEVDGKPGFIAHAEVYDQTGNVVGSADGICTRGERAWSKRDDYALSGMAQTRAISRACRQRFGFIVRLAGYNPTPAEEMGYAVVEDDYSVDALVQLTREKGIPVEKVKEAIAGQGAEKAADLTKNQLQEVIDRLKQEFSATME